MAVKWLDQPESHDFDAAASYLSMLAEASTVVGPVTALRSATQLQFEAKDILRAAQLPPLPGTDEHVKSDLGKIGDGKRLSPILRVRGDGAHGVPLQVLDGYQCMCASYLTDEDTGVPGRMASWSAPTG